MVFGAIVHLSEFRQLVTDAVTLMLCTNSPRPHAYEGKKPHHHDNENENTKRDAGIPADEPNDYLP